MVDGMKPRQNGIALIQPAFLLPESPPSCSIPTAPFRQESAEGQAPDGAHFIPLT